MEENTLEPRVAITSCASGFSCEEIVGAGMIVESINGCPTSTLADVRRCFMPTSGESWVLVTERGVALTVDFGEEMNQAVRLVHEDLSLLSKAVRDAAMKISNSSIGGNAEGSGPSKSEEKDEGGDEENQTHNESTTSTTSSPKATTTTAGRSGDQSDAEEYHQDVPQASRPPFKERKKRRRPRRSAGTMDVAQGGAAGVRPPASLPPVSGKQMSAEVPPVNHSNNLSATMEAGAPSSGGQNVTEKQQHAKAKGKHRRHKRKHGDRMKIADGQTDSSREVGQSSNARQAEQDKLKKKYNVQVTPVGGAMPIQEGRLGGAPDLPQPRDV